MAAHSRLQRTFVRRSDVYASPTSLVSIWIDAICNHQADTSERTQQVNIRGEIYKNSKEVLIWLDDVTPPTELEAIIWHDDERDQIVIDDYLDDTPADIPKPLRGSCAELAEVR